MSKGIYVTGDAIVSSGYRKPTDPPGQDWHDGLSASSWAAIEAAADNDTIRWDGAEVVVRDQAELDAIEAFKVGAADDAYIQSERRDAFLSLLLDEINTLRQQHSLPDRTVNQVRTAFKNKLGRP